MACKGFFTYCCQDCYGCVNTSLLVALSTDQRHKHAGRMKKGRKGSVPLIHAFIQSFVLHYVNIIAHEIRKGQRSSVPEVDVSAQSLTVPSRAPVANMRPSGAQEQVQMTRVCAFITLATSLNGAPPPPAHPGNSTSATSLLPIFIVRRSFPTDLFCCYAPC